MEMGWEGYGLFWALIEMLRNESDHRMQKHYKSIAFALHTNEESIKKLVNDFDLFGTDDQFFWSESLLKRMELKEAKSEKMRNAANKRWNKDDDAQAMQMHSISNAEAMQLKESKVNETKENLNEISSISIFTTRRLGGKNLFEEMAYIYDLKDEEVQKLYQEWDLTRNDQTFEGERHLKNSFILFVKNNASRFKQGKPAYQKSKQDYKSENVFSKLLAEEIEKENQTKP